MATSITSKTVFVKTERGKAAVLQRDRHLSLLQRRVLILCDGARSVAQLQGMVSGSQELLLQLNSMGMIASADAVTQPSGYSTQHADIARNFPSPVPPNVQHPMPRADFSATEPADLPSMELSQWSEDIPGQDDVHDTHIEELASNFEEQLSAHESSQFERDISGFNHLDRSEGDSPTSSGLQRAASVRGIALGKAYLLSISSSVLDSRDATLVRRIGLVKNDKELYQCFEELIEVVSSRYGTHAINNILERFDEEINR